MFSTAFTLQIRIYFPLFVLSPERDYYVRHHRNFTVCAWVWLEAPSDRDRDTMFGELEDEWEELPLSYRAHGSLHEMDVPLIVHNLRHPMPAESFFLRNFDLTRFLFRV